jgi:hypothetical protein
MTIPPFVAHTNPTAVLWATTTAAGHRISLRVPAVNDPVSCAHVSLDVHDAWARRAEQDRAAFADQAPCWWVEYADCPGPRDPATDDICACGVTDLYDLIDALEPATQQDALRAHVSALSAQRRHLALLDASGASDEMPSEMCVTCIADPLNHHADIDLSVDALSRDLIDAAYATGTPLLGDAR